MPPSVLSSSSAHLSNRKLLRGFTSPLILRPSNVVAANKLVDDGRDDVAEGTVKAEADKVDPKSSSELMAIFMLVV